MTKDGVKYFIRDNVFPHFYAFHAQSKIKRKIARLWEEGLNLIIANNKGLDLDAFREELEASQDRENDRKKTIEDKAKSCLFIVTLSITVMLGGINFVKDGKVTFRLPLLLLVISGVVYLVLSGVTAVQALNIREFYTLHPDDWIEEGQGRRAVVGLQRLNRIKMLYAVIKANELVLNIRTNFVHAAFIGIRNGIILLALAFIIAVGNIGNQVRFTEPAGNEAAKKASHNSDPDPGQSGTPQAQGASTPEAIAPANPQSGANSPEGQTDAADGRRGAGSPEPDARKGPGENRKKLRTRR